LLDDKQDREVIHLKKQYGYPLTILQFEKNISMPQKIELNKMLLHNNVKDRKVVVVSIVGAFRKGKTVFLNYCLRYLYANVCGFSF